jgi:DNA processing protein
VNNKLFFVALNRMQHVGPRTVARLLEHWPNLQELFQLSERQMINAGLTEKLASTLSGFDWKQVDRDLQWQHSGEGHVLTWSDVHYPALLKEIHDPPLVLYVKGDLSCLNQTSVAMVGTRNPSPGGSETARRFAFELASHGLVITSGLALGIDAQAHQGCLEAGGKTIAVMGTGVDFIYPRRHIKLAEQIIGNGVLMSEFPLQSPPEAGHFPRRNRIISGLSSVTLVVEAAIKSGSLITARLALEQNRDVLAIPGSIHNPQARGCHYLLQQGAKLVTSSDDVLEELGIAANGKTSETRSVLAGTSGNLVKCIGFEITTIDQIQTRSGLTIENVVCELAELELQGVVMAVPGGYTRCTV